MAKNNNFNYFTSLFLFFIFIGSCLALIFLLFSCTEEHICECDNKTVIDINYVDYHLAIEHIKEYEGLRLFPYQIPGDSFSYIGYGHQIRNFESFEYISEQEADSILINDLIHRIIYISNKYTVTGNQALALAMLIYNVSPSSVHNSKLGVQLLTYKDEDTIRESWLSFCRYNNEMHPMLKKRREFEINLYFKE